MRKILILSLVLISLTALLHPVAVGAAPAAQVSRNEAVIKFPDMVTFRASLQAGAKITSVVLEYGDEQLTCGDVVAKSYPQFTPGAQVDVEWTWEMRQSGSLPPGATIWWRWRFTDESGKESVSERQTITWLDSHHTWQTITAENLRLHWYSGDRTFAQEVLNAAKGGLVLNEISAGLKPDGTIDLYIYANYNDLGDAILYEPSWTGGQAFPDFNIVIIGIEPANLDWGKKATVHELTHVLVGHLTFSCLGSVPTWLNEGLAVYSEGELNLDSQNQLDEAIRKDELLTVRSISGGFSEVADKANLSYSQSFSIVKFLIGTYGQPKMTELLTTLRDGTTIDDALVKVYGFDVDGLEDAWRKGIGAKPRAASPNPTPVPSPTYVPTIVPVSGVPLSVTPTPFVVPTSSSIGVDQSSNSWSNSDTNVLVGLVVLLLCCCLLVIGIVALVIYFINRARKGDSHA